MNQALAQEAAELALAELKKAGERFTDATTDSARLKLAGAYIRLIQCWGRHMGIDNDMPDTDADE